MQVFWRIYFNIVEKFHFWILLKPCSTRENRTSEVRISRELDVDVVSYEFNRKCIYKISELFKPSRFRCFFKTEKFVIFFYSNVLMMDQNQPKLNIRLFLLNYYVRLIDVLHLFFQNNSLRISNFSIRIIYEICCLKSQNFFFNALNIVNYFLWSISSISQNNVPNNSK